jgi:hypothetical protein
MARTWLSIRVELVDGMHAHDLWPRPGRILLARPGMTFRQLADAINVAFARWDRAHLHAFTMADGTRISLRTPWDEPDDEALDDTEATLSRLRLGEQFTFEFDLGDSWMHLCTVAERKVDPLEVYGEVPDRPVPYAGWGAIPDQHGRRWDGDDGRSPVPAQPDPPLGDLPDLHYTWGSRAYPAMPGPDAAADEGADPGSGVGEVITGPWGPAGVSDQTDPLRPAPDMPASPPWSYTDVQDLRGALARDDLDTAVELLVARDTLAVVHLAGPGLLRAIEAGHVRAGLVVEHVLPELAARGWSGDDELVDEFDRVTTGSPDTLRPTPVDLGELAFHLDGPTEFEEGWMLEVATGQLWPRDPMGMAGIEEPEDFDDPDEYEAVLALGSRVGYGDMVDFIATITDGPLVDRLAGAIQGKGAFRRFKDTLHPHELWWGRWLTFSSERWLGRARWWLAEAGLRPSLD